MAIDQDMWLLWELDAKVIEGKTINVIIMDWATTLTLSEFRKHLDTNREPYLTLLFADERNEFPPADFEKDGESYWQDYTICRWLYLKSR